MATTSKLDLRTAILNMFNNISTGKTTATAADELADALDAYIIDVVSKVTGTTSTKSLLTGWVVVPQDGGSALKIDHGTSPGGEISAGGLSTDTAP